MTLTLSREEAIEKLSLLEELKRREQQQLFYHYFPDQTHTYLGQVMYARHLYPQHVEFFRAGANYRERAFRAANQVGKSTSGAYETTCHLTGLYPDWWEGWVFDSAIQGWACGKTSKTVRDINQTKLLGGIESAGGPRRMIDKKGIIPGELIGQVTWQQGIANAVDSVQVKHVSGEWSLLRFKAYEQGRGAFEGAVQHVIWLDEECPLDVYGECLTRTVTTNGRVMLTFTPLEGHSETVMQFMPDSEKPSAMDE